MQRVIPSILILVSAYWLYMAVAKYGLWDDEGPGGGFMPMLAALITIGFSIAAIVKTKVESVFIPKTIFIPVVIIIVLLLAVPYVGLLPFVFLMLLFWFRGLEHYSWSFTIIISSAVIFVVWAIFQLWLNVPFPEGIWGDLL